MTDTDTCEACGWFGNRTHPMTGANLIDEYKGETLCSSCRVDKRLADNDFQE